MQSMVTMETDSVSLASNMTNIGILWNIAHLVVNIYLGSEYLPSASGNIPTLDAIFIDVPRRRVEYL